MTRKRKQHPSNPLAGIFTRGKSRKYLHHCSRSGKLRPDPVLKTRPFPLSDPKTNQRSGFDNDDDDEEVNHISIKDLRARRVFSNPVDVKKEGVGKKENPNFDSEINVGKLDECYGKSDGVEVVGENPKLSGPGKCNFAAEGLDNRNSNFDTDTSVCKLDESDGGLGMVEKNPKFSELEKCDLAVDFRENGANCGNDNVSVLEKCDSRVVLKVEGSDGINPNLLEKGDLVVDFRQNVSDDGNEKCDSRVDLKREDLEGRNPNLAGVEDDKRSPNLLSGGGENEGVEKMEKFEVGLGCNNGEVKDDMSPESNNKESKGRKSGDYCDGVIEENVQTTPPDAVISVKQTENQIILQNRKPSSRSPPKQISPTKDEERKKSLSNSRRNSVLRPCSRPKIFKALNSFSYRRLLPYLMDMEKNTPSSPKLNTCVKTEDVVEEKPIISSSPKSLTGGSKSGEKQVTPVSGLTVQATGNYSNQEEEKPSLVCNDTNSIVQQASVETLADCSPNSSQVSLVSNEMQTPVTDESPKEVPQGEQVSSGNLESLGNVSPVVKTDESPVKVPKGEKVSSGNLESSGNVSLVVKTDPMKVPQDEQASSGNLEGLGNVSPVVKTDDNPIEVPQGEQVSSGNVESSGNDSPVVKTDESPIEAPQGEQVSSGNLEDLGNVSPVVKTDPADLSDAPCDSPEAPEKFTTSEAPCLLSFNTEGECSTALVECKTEENLTMVIHSAPKVEAVVSSSIPVVGLANGILKRNPRGCRGICNCLNCASFRLNAEKAFEFSRNQLLDTEELAQDLMKELSALRSMLEKSVNEANGLATISVDPVQEACRRASNVEDITRNRLSQMKEDLYVHCRTKPLQRPRVNFSGSVTEKVVGTQRKQMGRDAKSRTVKH